MIILGTLLAIWFLVNLRMVYVYAQTKTKANLNQMYNYLVLSFALTIFFTYGLFVAELTYNQPARIFIATVGFVILGGLVQSLITALMLRKAWLLQVTR